MSRLILLDVFSYSCMNCLRSLEFIKKIDGKYRSFGLDTILLHPPEWEFEKLRKNIEFASKKHKIDLPIIIDKNKNIIRKLKINFWPAQVLLKDNKILYRHTGEGDYKSLENKIIQLLKTKPKKIFKKEPKYSKFPTVYCGTKKEGIILDLKSNKKLKFGFIYKKGRWVQKNEYIKSIGENNSITILAKGKVANFVAESRNKKPMKVSVNSGGKTTKYLTISKPQLYKIVDMKNAKAHKLTMTANSSLAVYSFSFR